MVRGRGIRRPGQPGGKKRSQGTVGEKDRQLSGKSVPFRDTRRYPLRSEIQGFHAFSHLSSKQISCICRLPRPVFLFSPDTNPTEIYPFLSLKQKKKKKKMTMVRRASVEFRNFVSRLWNFLKIYCKVTHRHFLITRMPRVRSFTGLCLCQGQFNSKRRCKICH